MSDDVTSLIPKVITIKQSELTTDASLSSAEQKLITALESQLDMLLGKMSRGAPLDSKEVTMLTKLGQLIADLKKVSTPEKVTNNLNVVSTEELLKKLGAGHDK